MTLSLNNEDYQISQDEQPIFVKSWNQSVTYGFHFDDIDHQQTITFTIPEVTRATSATAKISFENKIDTSDFEFKIQVVCPKDETPFCENNGICENDISCNCDGTGFYGDICQYTCTPKSIEITGSDTFRTKEQMKYLGLFKKGDENKVSQTQGYNSNNDKQEIVFHWYNDTTAVLLDRDGQFQVQESSDLKNKCLTENEIFSDNLQIRAFDSNTIYYNHDAEDAPLDMNAEKCQQEQLACKDHSRCINEPWICDDLEDCEDKTDEEFEFCNKRANCCMHGVIFNSKIPEMNRLKKLGESASQAIGVYKRKDFQGKKRIEYEKNKLTLDWLNTTNSWIVSQYHDQGKNEYVWIGPNFENTSISLVNDRCVNQNHSTV